LQKDLETLRLTRPAHRPGAHHEPFGSRPSFKAQSENARNYFYGGTHALGSMSGFMSIQGSRPGVCVTINNDFPGNP
jgi:hypothetical protein